MGEMPHPKISKYIANVMSVQLLWLVHKVYKFLFMFMKFPKIVGHVVYWAFVANTLSGYESICRASDEDSIQKVWKWSIHPRNFPQFWEKATKNCVALAGHFVYISFSSGWLRPIKINSFQFFQRCDAVTTTFYLISYWQPPSVCS